jgi:hypothetical protein
VRSEDLDVESFFSDPEVDRDDDENSRTERGDDGQGSGTGEETDNGIGRRVVVRGEDGDDSNDAQNHTEDLGDQGRQKLGPEDRPPLPSTQAQ